MTGVQTCALPISDTVKKQLIKNGDAAIAAGVFGVPTAVVRSQCFWGVDATDMLIAWLREQEIDWPDDRVRQTVPLVQEKIERFSQYASFAGFLFGPVLPAGADPQICGGALRALETVEPGTWSDPEFLDTLVAGATALSLNAGETKTVDLRIAEAR